MGTKSRTSKIMLIDLLIKEGKHFNFFQAIFLYEKYLKQNTQNRSSCLLLKMRPVLTMGFSATDIVNVFRTEDETELLLEVSFLGLYGVASPLPDFYTEDLIENCETEDYARGFLDIFNNRILELFYQSWKKYRFHMQFHSSGKDNFLKKMFSLAGLNFETCLETEHEISSLKLLRFAGLLTQRPKSASTLLRVLNGFFPSVYFELKEMIGEWLDISPDDKNALGEKNSNLGVNFSLGDEVLDFNHKFRIVINPDSYYMFLKLLPDGEKLTEVIQIINKFKSDHLKFDIKLYYPDEYKPGSILTEENNIKLGFNSWVNAKTKQDFIVFST